MLSPLRRDINILADDLAQHIYLGTHGQQELRVLNRVSREVLLRELDVPRAVAVKSASSARKCCQYRYVAMSFPPPPLRGRTCY